MTDATVNDILALVSFVWFASIFFSAAFSVFLGAMLLNLNTNVKKILTVLEKNSEV